jgi:hypothetical protein
MPTLNEPRCERSHRGRVAAPIPGDEEEVQLNSGKRELFGSSP